MCDRVDLCTWARLAAGGGANGVAPSEPAESFDALGEDVGVARVRQEAVVDRNGRAGVARAEAYRATGVWLHREDGHACLVAVLARRIETGKEEEVTQPSRAHAAGDGDGHLGHEQRAGSLELRCLALQLLRSAEAEADADVVAKTLADGQLELGIDAASCGDVGVGHAVTSLAEYSRAEAPGRSGGSRSRPCHGRPRLVAVRGSRLPGAASTVA